MSVTAAEIMTRPVVTVTPATDVATIAALLASKGISAVPVCAPDGKLAGIVSEEDVLRPFRATVRQKRDRWLALLTEGEDLSPEFLNHIRSENRSAADIMAHDVHTASEHATVPELTEMMIERSVKRVPIVRDGRVVGIVSRTDLVRAIARKPAEVD